MLPRVHRTVAYVSAKCAHSILASSLAFYLFSLFLRTSVCVSVCVFVSVHESNLRAFITCPSFDLRARDFRILRVVAYLRVCFQFALTTTAAPLIVLPFCRSHYI